MRKLLKVLALLFVFVIFFLVCAKKQELSQLSQPGTQADIINKESIVNPVKSDSGTYVGRIDNNSIEIMISGVPVEIASKAFRLSDEVIKRFDDYKLETGEQVLFTYTINEYNQMVINSINKIKN